MVYYIDSSISGEYIGNLTFLLILLKSCNIYLNIILFCSFHIVSHARALLSVLWRIHVKTNVLALTVGNCTRGNDTAFRGQDSVTAQTRKSSLHLDCH